MDIKKMTIYLDKQSLELLILGYYKYPNLHTIIKKFAILWLDMSKEEIEEITKDKENYITKFFYNNGIKVRAKNEYFKMIYEDPSILIHEPRSIFFLDIEEAEAKKLSKRLGLIIQSNRNINDKILEFYFHDDYDQGELIGEKGWDDIFEIFKKNKIDLPPSNALVITDEYLFDYSQKDISGKSKNVGLHNVKQILKNLLPLNCEVPFQILVITSMNKIGSGKAKSLFEDLRVFLSTIRNYEIVLEFILTDTIHSRRIFSNYYVLTCDKGFNFFCLSPQNQIYADNDITLISVLNSPVSAMGSPYYVTASKRLKKIKNISENALKRYRKDNTDVLIVNNIEEDGIHNRLL